MLLKFHPMHTCNRSSENLGAARWVTIHYLELARVGRWIRERVAARSWQDGGAPHTGGAQANDNEASCDAVAREPSTPTRASS